MDRRLLMIPGPIEFEPDVLATLGERTRSHLDPTFIEAFGRAIGRTREVFLAGKDAQPFVIAGSGTLAMDSNLTTSFYNELAAVPSLHVGFAVAVGFALFAALRNPVLRYAALLWGPVIGLAVVATGNHFVFDMIAGVVASILGYGLGIVAARTRIKRPTTAKLGPTFAEA